MSSPGYPSFILPTRILPWSITVKDAEGNLSLLEEKGLKYMGATRKTLADGESLSFSWTKKGSQPYSVTVTVELSSGDELPLWSLRATLPDNMVVSRFTFPSFELPRSEEMVLLLPAGYGIEMDVTDRTQAFTQYPSGSGTMQLIMAYTPQGSYFLSTRDHSAAAKEFRAFSDTEGLRLYTTCTASEAWTHDGNFEVPWKSVFGYRPGRWEDTARQWYLPFTYKTDWGRQTLAERKIPHWLKDNDVWIQKSIRDTLFELLQTYHLLGKPCPTHWYGWHQHPFDTLYPEYFPEKEGIKEIFHRAQTVGGKVVPYINGRLFDPASGTYAWLRADTAMCRDANGETYVEVYHSQVPHEISCPSTPLWQRIQQKLVTRISDSLETAGVYIDQVACAAPKPCYAPNHPHAPGGGSW